MDFIKTKEFLFWVVLNAVFPIIVVLIFEASEFAMETQALIAYLTIATILVGNIFALVKFPDFRKLFGAIIVLNLLVTIFLGDMSFFSSIPHWGFIYDVFTQ